ncbi:MAG: class I SAM-dependent methyltransferase [Zoogloea sp.]|nr:class I SAM-dependent methyltransferase [Zoogloea sp.]
MKALNKLRGMRFPDEYIIRMFFKERLQERPGRVLELGCGSGNNLLLFQEFGWEVVGIDISADSLADACGNLDGAADKTTLLQADLAQGMPALAGRFDAIILPSFNYYVPRTSFRGLLAECSRLLAPGGLFFVRSRTCDDWRYGRGREVEPNGFILECTETGEQGLLNVFYPADELLDMLEAGMGGLHDRQMLKVHYENPQGGAVVGNDDVVIWGRRQA